MTGHFNLSKKRTFLLLGNSRSSISLFSGINYPVINYQTATPGISVKGSLGFQFGASYSADEKLAVEVMYRMVKANGAFDDGAGNVGDFDEISFNGLLMSVKYKL